MIERLETSKDSLSTLVRSFVEKQQRVNLLKRVFGCLKYHRDQKKFLKNAERLLVTWNQKRKMRGFLAAVKAEKHQRWKNENLPATLSTYQKSLESRFLNKWTATFETSMKYVEQMEERIRYEVVAREQLTKIYERSLNTGAEKLNNETMNMSESPLVREISLLVAKELLKAGQNNESINEMMKRSS